MNRLIDSRHRNEKIFLWVLLFVLAGVAGEVQGASNADYSAWPPTMPEQVDPNVMLNLSVETPMQGAAYNDQPDGASCSGRITDGGGTVGICYSNSSQYIGYFDPDKCYTYVNNRFEPASAASSHQCSGQWSGNFLNWATMTAIDEFRWALTGGNRQTDTTALTVLERTNMGLSKGDSWYPVKMITASSNVAPSTVTPYSDSKIYIYNHGYQVDFGTSWGGSQKAANLYVRVKVCDTGVSVEDNCVDYGDYYKPQGLIQDNAYRMRFALMSYTTDSSQSRDGGVLRANMKYVGPYRPASGGGLEINPYAEFGTDGIFVSNPDQVTLASGVGNSGVINYLNKFGSNGYKSYDPIGELFYECINYFKNRGPTSEYSSGLSDSQKDGFPVLTTWEDPITSSCQKNFILGINDANPWLDKQLPGTKQTSGSYFGLRSLGQDTSDYGSPSNADADIDVKTLTNTVGDLEGLTGTSQCIGCTATSCDMSATNKTINALGEVFGTCPYTSKENSYYIAGLAYYAHTQDLRSDLTGDQTITTFMVDTQEYNATPLTGNMNMLWLAGKYGGFSGGGTQPGQTSDWDSDGDGTPDNYVLASDPEALVEGLTQAFYDIMERVSSGTAAAVVSNSYSGIGGVYQALYYPEMNSDGKQIQWGGTLHALFIDSNSRFREDGDSDGVLDDCLVDPIIDLTYDTTDQVTKIRRYTTPADCDTTSATYEDVNIEQLRPIWDARDLLAQVSTVTTQRDYLTQPAISGRYITTWLDANGNGTVDTGEQVDFDAAHFSDAANYYYLQASTSAEAANIVNFIRGEEISGYRTRTLNYDGSGEKVWRLGDIIHSTPVAVAAPGETYGVRYDTLYNDASYRAFHTYYAARRQVVYVGANDGMLHAFNAGFWNESTKTFETSKGSLQQHSLGDELWAYAPFNLLPHLKWLTQMSYQHVYYMDDSPVVFDARIFTEDEDHPGGWGTVLVAGMRLGGGALDIDNDGTPETRSAYVVMDITNPEAPPKLMAELTDSALGFTVSQPAVAVRRSPGSDGNWYNPTDNDWLLIFGSGPTELAGVTASQSARLYAYDLVNKTWKTGFGPLDLSTVGGDGIANSFVPNVVAVDWNHDFVTDSVYLGTDGRDSVDLSQTGRLLRMEFSDWLSPSVSSFFNPDKPFNARPLAVRDANGDRWLVAGTGRLWTTSDNSTSGQQVLYGLKEPQTIGEIASANVQNVSGVLVDSDEEVLDIGSVLTGVTTYTDLETLIGTKDGWYRSFTVNGGNPSERSLSQIKQVERLALFSLYTPPTDTCSAEGTSTLNSLCYATGTACPAASMGTYTLNDGGVDHEIVQGSISLGTGIASTPVIHYGSGSSNPTVVTQMSTGSLIRTQITLPSPPNGRVSWREIEFD
ncbi:MAG: PilC/PilY family type IV pilus protein [Magnetococcus sp. THC-1_WYH]